MKYCVGKHAFSVIQLQKCFYNGVHIEQFKFFPPVFMTIETDYKYTVRKMGRESKRSKTTALNLFETERA